MSNSRDLTRFLGNKAIKSQTVGNTYGERMERKHCLEQQKAQTIQKPAKHRPVDNFAHKAQTVPTSQFINEKDKYAGKSYRLKNTVAYKSVASELLEIGKLEIGKKGAPTTDQDILDFTNAIINDKRLWNAMSVRRNFCKSSSQARAANNAQRTVNSMAKAQMIAKKKAKKSVVPGSSNVASTASPRPQSPPPVVNVPKRKV